MDGYKNVIQRVRESVSPQAFIAPVGLAWESLLEEGNRVGNLSTWKALYNPQDMFHPSLQGTYLAACTIAAALSGNGFNSQVPLLTKSLLKSADFLVALTLLRVPVSRKRAVCAVLCCMSCTLVFCVLYPLLSITTVMFPFCHCLLVPTSAGFCALN